MGGYFIVQRTNCFDETDDLYPFGSSRTSDFKNAKPN